MAEYAIDAMMMYDIDGMPPAHATRQNKAFHFFPRQCSISRAISSLSLSSSPASNLLLVSSGDNTCLFLFFATGVSTPFFDALLYTAIYIFQLSGRDFVTSSFAIALHDYSFCFRHHDVTPRLPTAYTHAYGDRSFCTSRILRYSATVLQQSEGFSSSRNAK